MIDALVDLKRDFPILSRQINGHRLVYLDSAATSQKPQTVIDAEIDFYTRHNANVLRSVHTLAEEATTLYADARQTVARFIHARHAEEVVFTRGTTESLNLVARGWGDKFLTAGDEIVVSPMEHHSNLIPWQQVALRTGAQLKFIELTPDGQITRQAAEEAIGPHTRVVALSAISNVLGTINPISDIAAMAHAVGAVMVVDGAQSVPHQPTDVTTLGADFLAFSGHKMCGPTGIGVLWGKLSLLEACDPVIFGGEMIAFVDRDHATWAEVPEKFEGGTPNIAGAVGLAAAIRYLEGVGMDRIYQHSIRLGEEAFRRLSRIEGVQVYGPSHPRSGLVAFNIDHVHPHDVAQVFDAQGVAIRAGHHCAQPLMQWLGVGSTARASFYFYNTDEDLDALGDAILETKRYFRR
ncbi:MAG: cysteine desulfurase [Sulfobacillus benefaciens]|uniref:cysteine desulfurase n=1 Tax=Sulfobacillus benefaciens TaxID=453960 RepID=A0A2T2XFX6_9FIRM|nr:MAG: cysteine desulfurase [Sulfobacillus benefaciens]